MAGHDDAERPLIIQKPLSSEAAQDQAGTGPPFG
jgi:hypothetical protein